MNKLQQKHWESIYKTYFPPLAKGRHTTLYADKLSEQATAISLEFACKFEEWRVKNDIQWSIAFRCYKDVSGKIVAKTISELIEKYLKTLEQ